MFRKKTVASIVAQFNKMIRDLEEVEEREELRAVDIADKIDRLEAEAAVARKEMEAAARVRYKIEELIS